MNSARKRMNINELEPVGVVSDNEWSITLNKLYDLSPDMADKIAGLPDGVTIWDTCFMQDLFLAVHSKNTHLIDIGWHPDGQGNRTSNLKFWLDDCVLVVPVKG